MDMNFNGKTAEGSVACDDNMKQKVRENLRDRAFDVAVAKAMKSEISKFKDKEVSCADPAHDCMGWCEFRTRNRNLDTTWKDLGGDFYNRMI